MVNGKLLTLQLLSEELSEDAEGKKAEMDREEKWQVVRTLPPPTCKQASTCAQRERERERSPPTPWT